MPLNLWHSVSVGLTAAISANSELDSSLLSLASIEAGLPIARLLDFAESSGFALRDLHEVVIPARTLKHRRKRQESLSVDESDKLARVMRTYRTAVEIFGDAGKAKRWLERPKVRFEGRSPLLMLRTETGGRMVRETLIQLDEGMFA